MDYETWSKEKLIHRIFDLEAAVQNLKGSNALDKTALFADAFSLSPLEARTVAALSSGRLMTRRSLLEVIYFDRSEPQDDRIATTFISKVRAKLFPFGVEIETIHGTGVRMLNPEIVTDALTKGRRNSEASAELPAPVAREKWARVLDEVKKMVGQDGIASFPSSAIKTVVNHTGGITTIMKRLETHGAIKILSRPTKMEPKKHWRVAVKGRVANG